MLVIGRQELEDLERSMASQPVLQKSAKSLGAAMVRVNVFAFIKKRVSELSGGTCPANFFNHDLHARNAESHTALHVAASVGMMESILTLIRFKCDINASSETGCTPLSLADNQECAQLLKMLGADGWTPLMVMAERGGDCVSDYLKMREIDICLRERRSFPDWFEEKANFFASLVRHNSEWSWGTHEPNNLVLSRDKMTIAKQGDSPDYSSALGSEAFGEGTYSWIIVVNYVRAMWVGIARGVEDEGLSLPPGACGQSIYFGSDGRAGFRGPRLSIQQMEDCSYSSGSRIEFQVDTMLKTLTILIDGQLAAIAKSPVDLVGFRPFLCMAYKESATLELQTSVVSSRTSAQELVSDTDVTTGLDNSVWTPEEDTALSALAGIFCRLQRH